MRLRALQACMAPWQQLVRCMRHHRHATCRRVLRSWAAYCQLLDAFFARVQLLLHLHSAWRHWRARLQARGEIALMRCVPCVSGGQALGSPVRSFPAP